MTTTEFDRWFDDLTTRFPSVETWRSKAAVDDDAARITLRNWCVAMDDVALTDALEINQRMQSGDIDWVGDFHWELLPAHVRRHAKALAADRTVKEFREQFAPSTSKAGSFPGAKILLRLWELRDEGMPHDEAREIALREFPVGRSPFREPRYNCGTCLDTGRILVATNEAIVAAMLGKFADCHHRDGAMKCQCRGHEGANPKRPLTVYDPQLDFRIEDPLWRPAEVSRFVEWVEWQRKHRAEKRLQSHPGYEAGFIEFNNRD